MAKRLSGSESFDSTMLTGEPPILPRHIQPLRLLFNLTGTLFEDELCLGQTADALCVGMYRLGRRS
jgi:hypothetical protein